MVVSALLRRLVVAALAAAGLAISLGPACATPPQSPAAQPGAVSPASPPVDPSTGALATALARSILIAVHQANVTGNYTVLRDLGAPGFRDRNSAADLAEVFAPIRKARIDLSLAASVPPEINTLKLDGQGVLYISGTLKIPGPLVRFEMLFQPTDGAWRLLGVSLVPVAANARPASAPK
jgi:hypothetical protein